MTQNADIGQFLNTKKPRHFMVAVLKTCTAFPSLIFIQLKSVAEFTKIRNKCVTHAHTQEFNYTPTPNLGVVLTPHPPSSVPRS